MKTLPITRLYTRRDIEGLFQSLGEPPLTQPTFSRWTSGRRALVRSVVSGGKGGFGNVTKLDRAGVVLLRWLSSLRGSGVSLQSLRKALDYIREELPGLLDNPEAYAFIVTGPGRVVLARRGSKIGEDVTRAQGQLVALSCFFVRETVEALARFDAERERKAA